MKFNFLALVFFLVGSISLQAQTGKISGKVVDAKTGEELIGANILLKGTTQGASADIDGSFLIEQVAAGEQVLIVKYVAYATKEVPVQVQAGKTVNVTVLMEDAVTIIEEVVIKAEAKKETVNAFLIERQKSNISFDGITAETIKRSPDNNSGEAIKRVSGATLQGGKFAIIRGLNERYNLAMINNSPLPSTEPEKRAFALDLFPSNMLDQLLIVKSGTADLPGDWSGGVIMVKTKDVPDDKFFNFGLSGSVNHLTTFGNFNRTERMSGDWIGLGANSRALPDDFPTTSDIFRLKGQGGTANRRLLASYGTMLPNNYGYENVTASPNFGVNLNGGRSFKMKDGSRLGVIFSGLYSNSRSFRTIDRSWWTTDKNRAQNFKDSTYESDSRLGGMLNFQWKIKGHSKITFKNTYNHNGEDLFTLRSGFRDAEGTYMKAYSYQYTFNQMFYSQLGGEHNLKLVADSLGKKMFFDLSKVKITWETAFGKTRRNLPDYRNVEYVTQNPENGYNLKIQAQNGSEDVARLFTDLNEEIKSAAINLEFPYARGRMLKGAVRTGYFHQYKQRYFNGRFVSYSRPTNNAAGSFDLSMLSQGIDRIFSPENFFYAQGGKHGLLVDDITRPYHSYYANAGLNAGYINIETGFLLRHRLIYGVRVESYHQVLNSKDGNNNDINVDTVWTSILPSASYIFAQNNKTNLRVSYFRSLSRPEFRELAPFAFLDFQTFSILTGNPRLQLTTVDNAEIRYEHFPAPGEVYSASVFYKSFKNPIELLLDNSITLGAIGRFYTNLNKAQSYGVEFDFRKNLGSFNGRKDTSWLDQFTFYGNFSYIFSEINLGSQPNTWNSRRPMQGQSPYIINLGLQWEHRNTGWVATILYNTYGNRIYNVGTATLPDIYEKSRSVIDLQISKKMVKDRLEIKLGISDLLAQDLLYFFDYNKDKQFNSNDDREVFRYRMPRMLSFGLSYKL